MAAPSALALEAVPIWGLVIVVGASVGSFLNVVVYRLPTGLSVLSPPSRCPRCLQRLSWFENVPVFGWVGLRGRCRHCRAPIAVRYPLVEGAGALWFALTFWQFGVTWHTLGYWIFGSFLLALALIDRDTKTLPNALTQPLLLLGLGFQTLLSVIAPPTATASVLDTIAFTPSIISSILGAVVGLWLFDTVRILGSIAFGRTAMGAGDAKLAAAIGAWLGWALVILAGFIACTVGVIWGVGATWAGWRDRRSPMPFGPFLAIGSVIALFWGRTAIILYLQQTGLATIIHLS